MTRRCHKLVVSVPEYRAGPRGFHVLSVLFLNPTIPNFVILTGRAARTGRAPGNTGPWNRAATPRATVPCARTGRARRDDGQGDLFWTEARPGTGVWEFAVLATSLGLEVRTLAQLYRDRADAENGFD